MPQGPIQRAPLDRPLEAGAGTAPGPPARRRAARPHRALAVDGDPVPARRLGPLPAAHAGALRAGRRRLLSVAGRNQLSSVVVVVVSDAEAGSAGGASAVSGAAASVA